MAEKINIHVNIHNSLPGEPKVEVVETQEKDNFSKNETFITPEHKAVMVRQIVNRWDKRTIINIDRKLKNLKKDKDLIDEIERLDKNIDAMRSNWTEDTVPQNVRKTIDGVENQLGNGKAEKMKEVFINNREKIVTALKAEAATRGLDLTSKEETKDKELSPENHIKKFKSVWKKERQTKLAEIAGKTDIKALENSLKDYSTFKANAEGDFTAETISQKLKDKVKELESSDETKKYGLDLKASYVLHLEAITSAIDDRLEEIETSGDMVDTVDPTAEPADEVAEELDEVSKKEMEKMQNTWGKSKEKSIAGLESKDEAGLIKIIKSLEKKIAVLQDNWDEKAPKTYKKFIDRHNITDNLRTAQIKNDYIMSKVDILQEAERLLTEKSSESETTREYDEEGELILTKEEIAEDLKKAIADVEKKKAITAKKEWDAKYLSEDEEDEDGGSWMKNMMEVKKEKSSWMKNMMEGGSDQAEGEVKSEEVEEQLKEEYAEQFTEAVNNMDDERKKGVYEKIADIGNQLSITKGIIMSSAMEGLAFACQKNKSLSSYFTTYKESYEEEIEKAQTRIDNVNEGVLDNTMSSLKGGALLLKYGRVAYDSGVSILSPTAMAMIVGRSSEVAKKNIFKGERLKTNTRVEEKVIFDVDNNENEYYQSIEDAMQEAEDIFGVKLGDGGTERLTKEDMDKAYKKQIPEDLMRRLARLRDVEGVIDHVFSIDVNNMAERIMAKIDNVDAKYEDKEENNARKQKILDKYDNLLSDFDKMVSHYGVVDRLAYSARIAEKAGKYTANALMIDSLVRIYNATADTNLFKDSWKNGTEAFKNLVKSKFESGLTEELIPLKQVDYSHTITGSKPLEMKEIDGNDPTIQKAREFVQTSKSTQLLKETHVNETVPSEAEELKLEKVRAAIREDLANEVVPEETEADKVLVKNALGQAIKSGVTPTEEVQNKTTESLAKEYSSFESIADSVVTPDTESVEVDLNAGEKASVVISAELKEQVELATIGAGRGQNSIEGVFIKQLEKQPENFGFEGDLEDKKAIHTWAGRRAHVIAIDSGYFNQETGEGVRMKASSIGTNAYVLKNIVAPDGTSVIGVDEYENGLVREKNYPDNAFENGEVETNEYVNNPEKSSQGQSSVTSEVEPQRETAGSSNEEYGMTKEDVLSMYEDQFGIGPNEYAAAGIDTSDGFTALESEKLDYMIKGGSGSEVQLTEAVLEKRINAIQAVAGTSVSFEDGNEYYEQLKELTGNPQRQEGMMDVLKNQNYREGFSKIFGVSIPEGRILTEDNIITIKNVEPGCDIVIKNEGGDMKFGIDGPIGNNWGTNGKTWRFKPDAAMSNEKISEAMEAIKKIAKQSVSSSMERPKEGR